MSESAVSAGQRLSAALDGALQREADRLGQRLRWDEREQHHIDTAVRAADHVELLQQLLHDELGGGGARRWTRLIICGGCDRSRP